MKELILTDKEFYELCVKGKSLSELSYLYFVLVRNGDLRRAEIVKEEERKREKELLKGVDVC